MPQFLGARDCLRAAAGTEGTRAAMIQEGMVERSSGLVVRFKNSRLPTISR